MGRIWLLFVILTFSVLFLFYRPTGTFCFRFSEYCMPLDTVAYLVYEHVGWIIVSFVMLELSEDYKVVYYTFLIIQVVDFVLFILFYRSPVFFGIPWNGAKVAVYSVPLLYYTWKDLQARFHNT